VPAAGALRRRRRAHMDSRLVCEPRALACGGAERGRGRPPWRGAASEAGGAWPAATGGGEGGSGRAARPGPVRVRRTWAGAGRRSPAREVRASGSAVEQAGVCRVSCESAGACEGLTGAGVACGWSPGRFRPSVYTAAILSHGARGRTGGAGGGRGGGGGRRWAGGGRGGESWGGAGLWWPGPARLLAAAEAGRAGLGDGRSSWDGPVCAGGTAGRESAGSRRGSSSCGELSP
jgi:hypothetical protein